MIIVPPVEMQRYFQMARLDKYPQSVVASTLALQIEDRPNSNIYGPIKEWTGDFVRFSSQGKEKFLQQGSFAVDGDNIARRFVYSSILPGHVWSNAVCADKSWIDLDECFLFGVSDKVRQGKRCTLLVAAKDSDSGMQVSRTRDEDGAEWIIEGNYEDNCADTEDEEDEIVLHHDWPEADVMDNLRCSDSYKKFLACFY